MLRKNLYKNLDKYKKTRNSQKKRYYDRTVGAANRYLPWTSEEDLLVIQHNISDKELSKKIKRSMNAILVRRNRLKNKVIKENKKMKIQKYKRGQVWWYSSSGTWDGTTYNQGKSRPVIIISNDLANANSNSLICVPCTTQEKKLMPTHITFEMNGLNNTALAENLLNANIDKLTGYIATLDNELMEKLEGAILVALGMKNAIAERCEYKNIPITENIVQDNVQTHNVCIEDDKPALLKQNNRYYVKPDKLTLKMVEDLEHIKQASIKPDKSNNIPKNKRLSQEEKKQFLKEYETKSKKYMLNKYNLKSDESLFNKAYIIRKQLKEG